MPDKPSRSVLWMMRKWIVLALFTLFAWVNGCSSAPTPIAPDLCPKYVMDVFDQGERVSSSSFVFEQTAYLMWNLRSGKTSNKSGLNTPWIENVWMRKKDIEGGYRVLNLSQGRTVHLTHIDWEKMFNGSSLSTKQVRLSGRLDGHVFVGSIYLDTESGPVRLGEFVATCDDQH